MFFVYILKSLSSGRYYIGQTSNLDHRLNRHNENKVKSTKNQGPWKLCYHEQYQTRSEAMKREIHLKSLKSRKQIERLIDSVHNN